MRSDEFTYLEKMMMIADLPDNKLIAMFNLVTGNERQAGFPRPRPPPKDKSNDNAFFHVACLVIFSG